MLVLEDIELFHFIFYVDPELKRVGWMLAVNLLSIFF